MHSIIEFTNKSWPIILQKIRSGDLMRPITERKWGRMEYYIPISPNKKRIVPLTFLDTIGCFHTLNGGCTMCAFNVRNKQNNQYKKQIMQNARDIFNYLDEVNKGYKFKIFDISTGGSFFDESEVPTDVRRYIYHNIAERKKGCKQVIFRTESRLEFINQEILEELKYFLGKDAKVMVGYGIESTNPLIRDGCIFKRLPHDVKEKILLLKRYGIVRSAHVMVKPPFLTEREAVEDTVKSTRDLFINDLADEVVVMTMHSRPNTLIRVLEENRKYKLPSIWTVVEIVKRLGPELCKKCAFNGFVVSTRKKAEYERIEVVKGCMKCHPVIMPKIFDLKKRTFDSWDSLMGAAGRMNCECKKRWKKEMQYISDQSLEARIKENIMYLLNLVN